MVLADVFDSLYQTAAVNGRNSNAQEFANTLRCVAKASMVLADVFDSLYQAAAVNVLNSSSQSTSWMTTSSPRTSSRK